jgi:hypothetical protein
MARMLQTAHARFATVIRWRCDDGLLEGDLGHLAKLVTM